VRIRNEIKVAAPPRELFEMLADVERVVPCMPGASLDGREGDDYTGAMKVRVGPINARYRGRLRFQELDKDELRAVMRASGNEVDGGGSAEATITAVISGSDSESTVELDTELQVRGRAAQFGRGVLANVSQRLVEEFARNLESRLLGSKQAPVDDEAPPPAEDSRPSHPGREQEPEALDALAMFATPRLKGAGLALGAFAFGLLVGHLVRPRILPVVYAAPPEGERARWGRRFGARA
jgi:carbon monoxide dehydrogenase subunit G